MLVGARGEKQEAAAVFVGDPVADRERGANVGKHLERAEMGGQHGADAERGLRVLGIDDGLRDGPLHGFGERGEIGLEQVVDQHAVLGDALVAEDARAVREQLAGGGDPERIHRVLLLGDQRRRHGVEVARVARLKEGRPAGRAGIERVEQRVAGGIEEAPRIAPHLVVEDAALAAGADLRHEVGDQHGLARARGARDDGMAGLGAVREGHARDRVRRGPLQHRVVHPPVRRAHAAGELAHARELRAAQPFRAVELAPPDPEQQQEHRDRPRRGLRADERAREYPVPQPLADPERVGGGGEVADGHDLVAPVPHPDLLAGGLLVAEHELGLGDGHHEGGVPVVAVAVACHVPDREGHHGERCEEHPRSQQLAPHAEPVEDGLPAAQRVGTDRAHWPHSASEGADADGVSPASVSPPPSAPASFFPSFRACGFRLRRLAGEHVDHPLRAGDDDLGDRPVPALAVAELAVREAALDQHRRALPHHRLDRVDGGAVDGDPVPRGAFGGLPVIALPPLRRGQAERRGAPAVGKGADVGIAPGMAQQRHAVDMQHRPVLLSVEVRRAGRDGIGVAGGRRPRTAVPHRTVAVARDFG